MVDRPPCVSLATEERAHQAAGIRHIGTHDLDDIEHDVCRAIDGRPLSFAAAPDLAVKTDREHVSFIEPVNAIEAPYVEK